MAKFTVDGHRRLIEVMEIVAESREEAVFIFRQLHPDFRVDGIDNEEDGTGAEFMGSCEGCGVALFDDSDYATDEYDCMVCRDCQI